MKEVKLTGFDGWLTLKPKSIIIQRIIPMRDLRKKQDLNEGATEIPIKNITAIRFKSVRKPETKGFIEFTILGEKKISSLVKNQNDIFDSIPTVNEFERSTFSSRNKSSEAKSNYNETVWFTKAQQNGFKEIKRFIDTLIDEEPITIKEQNIPKEPLNSVTQFQSKKVENLFQKKEKKPLVLSNITDFFKYDMHYRYLDKLVSIIALLFIWVCVLLEFGLIIYLAIEAFLESEMWLFFVILIFFMGQCSILFLFVGDYISNNPHTHTVKWLINKRIIKDKFSDKLVLAGLVFCFPLLISLIFIFVNYVISFIF